MSLQPEKLNDLLSGMLDGMLSDAERIELEQAMAADPSIEKQLDELANLRRSLLRGRKVARLGEGFTKRVSELAKERAADLGDRAPTWLHSGSDSPRPTQFVPREPVRLPTVEITTPDERIRLGTLVALAVAACITIVVFILPIPDGKKQTAQIKNPVELPGSKAESNDPTIEASDLMRNQMEKVAPSESQIAAAPTLENPEIADVEPEALVGVSDSQNTPNKTEQPKAPVNQIADDSKSMPATEEIPANSVVAVAPGSVPMNDSARNALASNGNTPNKFSEVDEFLVTMIIDVSLDSVAVENKSIETLLEKYGFVYADDLNLNSEQLESVVAARLAGARVDGGNSVDGVTVMFLKGKDRAIDSLYVELEANYKDFPELSLDLTMDPSVRSLVKQLRNISLPESPAAYASKLTYRRSQEDEMFSTFEPKSRLTNLISIDKRKKRAAADSNTRDAFENRDSHALLLIRGPK